MKVSAPRALRTLRARFLTTVAVLLFVVVGTTSTLAVQRESAALLGELERTARGTVALLAPTATNSLFFGDLVELTRTLEAVRAQEGVVDAVVVDLAGDVVADGREGRVVQRPAGRSLDTVSATARTMLRDGGVLDAVQPLVLGNERIGTLMVSFSMAPVERAAVESRNRTLGTGLVLGIGGLLLTGLVVRGVTRRLQHLTAAAREAAEQQLPGLVAGLRAGADLGPLAPKPLPVSSGDEVGHLAEAFNSYRGVVLDMAVELTDLLRSSDARFQRAFDASPIGMALTTPDSTMIEVNAALCRMLGRSREEMLGGALDALAYPDDLAVRGSGRQGRTDVVQVERRYLRPDGEVVWTLHTAIVERTDDGAPHYVVTQLVDTTHQKHAEAQLAHQAFHDELTGLPNRARLLQVLEQTLATATAPEPVALLLLDLDRFKLVNDSFGHASGDDLLRQVAFRLAAVVRPGDTVARLGGDEFVVLAPRSQADSGQELGRRIIDALAQPVTIAGRVLHPSASVGVALGHGGISAADLLRDADTAAYAAKAAGRGTVAMFGDELREQAQARLRIEEGIRHGLGQGEFRCAYQPVFDAASRTIVAVEALVRWQHHGRLRAPGEFLDVAEDSGLIVPLGRHVLHAACTQLREWHQLGQTMRVAVNVAPQQLVRDDGLPDYVSQILADTGLPADALYLEITESTLMEPEAEAVVHRLRDQGIRIALDDFGTGYSSLSYLRRLPVDLVKLDRSFAADLGRDPRATAVIAAVIELSHALDLPVVAEGVERDEQAELLTGLGCDLLQGYGLAMPMPAEDITGLLRRSGPPTSTSPLPFARVA